MSESRDLAALVEQPFELLAEMERRSRQAHAGEGAGAMPAEWVGVGFRIGEEQFVASRDQVREVLMLPESMTRVPGAKRWLLGIANLRGHLLPLVDVKLLLGSGRTTQRPHDLAAYDAGYLGQPPGGSGRARRRRSAGLSPLRGGGIR